MVHSKTKFNIDWLKKKMGLDICQNGGAMHIEVTSSRLSANYVIANSGYHALLQHARKNLIRKMQYLEKVHYTDDLLHAESMERLMNSQSTRSRKVTGKVFVG